jgi:hypothetical protein
MSEHQAQAGVFGDLILFWVAVQSSLICDNEIIILLDFLSLDDYLF